MPGAINYQVENDVSKHAKMSQASRSSNLLLVAGRLPGGAAPRSLDKEYFAAGPSILRTWRIFVRHLDLSMSQIRSRSGFEPPVYSHTSETVEYTLSRQTAIRMPMLGKETDVTAFFVLDHDTPVAVRTLLSKWDLRVLIVGIQMINEVLEKVYEESGVYHLWAADNKAESFPKEPDLATVPPIAEDWQSAFAGQTIEQAFEFLSTLPIDVKVSVNRTYIVLLDKHLYRTRGWVIVCKIDKEGTITTVPCAASNPILHIDSYSWHLWPEDVDTWRREGKAFL
jgi:hypothetical protein